MLTGSGLPLEQPGRKDYLIDAEQNSAQSALAGASFDRWGNIRHSSWPSTPRRWRTAASGLPQLVSKITDRNGQVIRTFGREVLNRTKIEDEYWRIVEDGMSKVTAHGFDGFPYPYYRKTGTSQQQGVNGEMLDNAVFIAYAPQDKPKLAVAVVVPEGGFGAYGAAPIGQAIFDAYDEVYGLTGSRRRRRRRQRTAPAAGMRNNGRAGSEDTDRSLKVTANEGEPQANVPLGKGWSSCGLSDWETVLRQVFCGRQTSKTGRAG